VGFVHATAYDARRDQIGMFGGYGSTVFDDTWTWNGLTWTNLPVSGPPARRYHAMVYDPKRDRVVLFGGENTIGTDFADTWEWNGTAWTNVTPTSVNPSASYGHSPTYDAAGGRVVMFGGRYGSGTNDLGDTWEWNGTSWTEVTPVSGSPNARNRFGAAYDTVRNRLVIFGGSLGSAAQNDTYEWDGSAWANVTPTGIGLPPARRVPALAHDAKRNRVVLFGGANNSQFFADTWELDGARWRSISPSSSIPTARIGAGMVYDGGRSQVTMFGGQQESGVITNDTWIWDGSAWTDVTPTSSNPAARTKFGIAYDVARDRVVLFGGLGSSAYLDDTWEWNGSAWTNVTPASGNPPGRWYHSMAYDAKRNRIVLYGGWDANGRFNDTWEWNGTAWTNVTPVLGLPNGRLSELAYDAARGRVVMFGGWDGLTQFDETWEWSGTAWTKLSPASSVPAPRYQQGMTYDVTEGRTVIFSGATLTNDTWMFRYNGDGAVDGCLYGLDGDSDGLFGCADPDCFGRCTPTCNPTIMTCPSNRPRCGDGQCFPVESARMCPADCGPPTTICGDFLCDPSETAISCPGDC